MVKTTSNRLQKELKSLSEHRTTSDSEQYLGKGVFSKPLNAKRNRSGGEIETVNVRIRIGDDFQASIPDYISERDTTTIRNDTILLCM